VTWIEEMTLDVTTERKKAWKERIKEKLGRESVSSVKDYVVAGCILDIIDDIWRNDDIRFFQEGENRNRQQYNVFVYQTIRYPPHSRDKKGF
jgi:hypothetical protein